jgi:hypothetical protein
MRTMLGRTSAMVIALASTIEAQRVRGGVSVVGGSATDVVGITSRALTVSPSLSLLPDSRVAIGLEAAGTRFDEGQWSLAGGITSVMRLPINSFASLGLDAAGASTTTSYKVSYQTATAIPFVEVAAGPVVGFVGARGAFASVRAEQTTSNPSGLFGRVPSVSRNTIEVSRTGRALVYGISTRFANRANETMRIGAREERGTVDTVPTIDRTASVTVDRGRITVGGNIGLRSERAQRSTFGTGSLAIAVTPVAAIEITAGAYPANRLVGAAPGRFFNVGLSLHSGRTAAALAIATGVPSVAAGFTRLTLREKNAQRVEVLGDFTHWKATDATRADNDVWYVDLRIPPGEYRYAFRVNGTIWRVPEGAVAIDDDFGGKSARLVVTAPSSSSR